MKLIKFENGTYGVTRYRWLFFCYEFLDLTQPAKWEEDCNWECMSPDIEKVCQGTKEVAQNRIQNFYSQTPDVKFTVVK
jgi:hypothetical protein